MTIEHSTPTLGLLKEFGKISGINNLLLDLDDTLIDTNTDFIVPMTAFAEFIASKSPIKVTTQEVFESMGKILESLRGKFHVNPTLMTGTSRLLAAKYAVNFFSLEIRNQFKQISAIYRSVPKPFEKSVETVSLFKEAGFCISILTNSDPEWAEVKVKENHFKIDNIFVVPSTEFKNKWWWEKAIIDVGDNPRNVIAVGDSWNSDISPAIQAGVPAENVIRVKTRYSNSNRGRVPFVTEVESFSNIPQLLVDRMQLLRRSQLSNQ